MYRYYLICQLFLLFPRQLVIETKRFVHINYHLPNIFWSWQLCVCNINQLFKLSIDIIIYVIVILAHNNVELPFKEHTFVYLIQNTELFIKSVVLIWSLYCLCNSNGRSLNPIVEKYTVCFIVPSTLSDDGSNRHP